MGILKAYNHLYVAILLVLFYQGVFLSYFQLHPKISYAIAFLSYALVLLLHKNNIAYVNKWLLLSLAAVIPSILVGFYMEWNIVDISADIVRYIAPFLGYSVGVLLLRQLEYTRIVYILYGLLALQVISYYSSVISKASYVFQGGPIIEYAKHGLEVHSLYFFIAYFLLRNKLVFGVKKVLLAGYVIGYILNPIFLMSKARFLAVLLSFALIFIFYSNFKDRVLIAVFSLFLVGASIPHLGEKVFSRIQDTVELIETNEYSADASTAVRVAEMTNIANMLYDKFPYSLPFGFGSGALYYDNYVKIEGGISQENFRLDGGVHDVFFAPLAYVFRYGLIGLLLMIYFVVHHYKKILVSGVNKQQNTIATSLKLFIVISLFADLFVPVHVYGNLQFGFFVAMGVILQSKFNNQNHSSGRLT